MLFDYESEKSLVKLLNTVAKIEMFHAATLKLKSISRDLALYLPPIEVHDFVRLTKLLAVLPACRFHEVRGSAVQIVFSL